MTDINKEYEKEYYDEYRNNYYNPDDDDGEPGINLNWKRIQKGFHSVAGNDTETAETLSGMQANLETLNTDVETLKTDVDNIKESIDDLNTAVETAEQAAEAAAASEAAAEAAQAAIEDIAESIPADYTELSDDVSELKNALNSGFDFIPSINLFDDDFDETGYIVPSTGEDAAASDLKRTSHYYEILDTTATTIYGLLSEVTQTFTIVFYDENKAWTGYYGKNRTDTSFSDSIPSGSKYFRVYTNLAYSGQSCISTVYTADYVEKKTNVYLRGELKDDSVSLLNLSDDIVNANNLVTDIIDSTYLNYNNGNVSSYDTYRATNYIPVAANEIYYIGICNNAGAPSHEVLAISAAFYNSSKTFISNSGVYSSGNTHTNCTWEGGLVKITAPATAAYVRIGTNDNADKKLWYFGTKNGVFIYRSNKAIIPENLYYTKPLSGKIVACFGDSIIGNTRDYTSTPAYISKATGATVYNFGFGGCRMSVHETGWDNCSMYRLADDIYNGSFSDLVSAITTGWSGVPGYFANTAAWLNACDFSEIDAIIISYGTNDYRNANTTGVVTTLDNPNDKFDTSTVCGALRYSIKQILTVYPRIQILVTCPIFRTFFADGTTTPEFYSDTKDWHSGTLVQYAAAYKQACDDMNVPFLDLYHETCFNPYSRLYFYPTDDGTHPNEKGRERLGNVIGGKLITLF